jgi:hypothetical protein
MSPVVYTTSGHVLYSTNAFLKYYIQNQYMNGVHYVWCSEVFDGGTAAAYTPTSLVGTSSNPKDIYRNLVRAIETQDDHDYKVTEQRASTLARAVHGKVLV